MKLVVTGLLWYGLSMYGSAQNSLLPKEIRLQDFGANVTMRTHAGREHEVSNIRQIAFDHGGKVYVGFPIRGEAGLLKPGESPNIYRILVIDAESNTVVRTIDFATTSLFRNGIGLSWNDVLMVIANDEVQIANSPDKVKVKLPPAPTSYLELWSILESATGKTLLINSTQQGSWFLDPNTLKTIRYCPHKEGVDSWITTFTDSMTLRRVETSSNPQSFSLLKGEFCSDGDELENLRGEYLEPAFISDSRYVLYGKKTLRVKTLDGHLILEDVLPDHFNYVDDVRASLDGNSFGVTVSEERGGVPFLDGIGSKILSFGIDIYDIEQRRKVKSIRISPPGIEPFDFAFSPDGKTMAVLDKGIVEIIKF